MGHEKQETQLSWTNRATRLEVSQGHQTWYHSMLSMVSYYCAIVVLFARCTFFRYSTLKNVVNVVTLKTGLGSVKLTQNIAIR